MAEFVQYVINGVIYGSLLALVGLGTTVIFRTTQVLNFAQGGIMATTGYSAAMLVSHLGGGALAYWFVVVIAALIGAVLGLLIGLLMLAAESRASHFEMSVASLGVTFILSWLDRVLFGTDPVLMQHISNSRVTVLGASVSVEGLVIIAVTIIIAALAYLVIERTRTGLAMRAVNEDAVTARTYGISRTVVTLASWALGCAIAGVAGVLVGSYIQVDNSTALNISVISLAALVVGGLGSMIGSLVGGVTLGVAASIVAGYLAPDYKNSIVFLLVLLLLVVRPQGLFGERRVKVAESGEQRRQLPSLPRPGSWRRPVPVVGAVLVLGVLIALPSIPHPYPLATYAVTLGVAAAVLSISFLQFYVGELSLGQGALVTIGGYTVAYLTTYFSGLPFVVAALAAVVLAAAAGALSAGLTLRMSGLHLGIATMVLVYVVIELSTQWKSVTGGASGTPVPTPSIRSLNATTSSYFVALGVFVIVAAAGVFVLHSKLGYRVVALRDASKAAVSMGISPNRLRTYAFTISSAMAGLAGVALAVVVSYIGPTDFGLLWSFIAIVGAVIGGGRLVSGALIGGVFVTFVPVIFSKLSGLADGLFGLTLVVFILLAPGGLGALWDRGVVAIDRYRRRLAGAAAISALGAPSGDDRDAVVGTGPGDSHA